VTEAPTSLRAGSGRRGRRAASARVLRRALRAGALAVAVSVATQGCIADLGAPSLRRPAFIFTSSLHDTVVNLGDTSAIFPCWLTVGDRDVSCYLGLVVKDGHSMTVIEGPRVFAGRPTDAVTIEYVPGTVTVEVRPLNVQLQRDTIVRLVRVRTVAPRVRVANLPGGEDTLTSIGQERLYIPWAVTRSDRFIAGAPYNWEQESGHTVASLVDGVKGLVRALGNGVAVFRLLTDTATVRFRVRVEAGP